MEAHIKQYKKDYPEKQVYHFSAESTREHLVECLGLKDISVIDTDEDSRLLSEKFLPALCIFENIEFIHEEAVKNRVTSLGVRILGAHSKKNKYRGDVLYITDTERMFDLSGCMSCSDRKPEVKKISVKDFCKDGEWTNDGCKYEVRNCPGGTTPEQSCMHSFCLACLKLKRERLDLSCWSCNKNIFMIIQYGEHYWQRKYPDCSWA